MILRLYHVALGLRTKVHDARLEVADNEDMRHYFKAARKKYFFAWSITDFRGNLFLYYIFKTTIFIASSVISNRPGFYRVIRLS